MEKEKITIELGATDQMLHELFTTAMEGGIGYWSCCHDYHWQKDNKDDLQGFYAVVDDDGESRHRIDRSTIIKGIIEICKPEFEICNSIRGDVLQIAVGVDDVDYDANTADCIVQAGLFNELVYG